jgi:hypothetical protein
MDMQRAEVAVVLKSDESGVLVMEIPSGRTETLSGWERPSTVRPGDVGILYWATAMRGGSAYTGWWFRRSATVGGLLAALPSADRLKALLQVDEVWGLVETAKKVRAAADLSADDLYDAAFSLDAAAAPWLEAMR